MTLTGIAIGADHLPGFVRSLETEVPHELARFLDRDSSVLSDRLFQDRHEFALKGAVAGGRSPAKLLGDLIGHVLDRQVDRQNDLLSGSRMVLF
jgi:hypothetical protein